MVRKPIRRAIKLACLRFFWKFLDLRKTLRESVEKSSQKTKWNTISQLGHRSSHWKMLAIRSTRLLGLLENPLVLWNDGGTVMTSWTITPVENQSKSPDPWLAKFEDELRRIARQMNISHTTVLKAAHLDGLRPYHRAKKLILSQKQQKHRVQWTRGNRKQDWQKVLFSD